MDDNCPECGNEIYKPYTYCNACGWEKKEEEPKKEKKGKKDKKKAPTKGEAGKTIKIKCKCGGDIKIKSSSKPVKIKCPNCGRTGVFKGIGPSKPAKPKPKPKKEKEKVSRSLDGKERREHRARDVKRASRDDQDHRERRHEKKEKTRHKKGVRTKGRPRSRSDEDLDRRPTGRKRPTHKPPAHSKVVKRIKGKCSWCQSRNLRFFDDGSGRCADCGKEFKSGSGASRIQKKEYLCERCREPLEFVKEYDRWYCYKCNEYA